MWRSSFGLLALAFVGGCPMCDYDGAIDVVGGRAYGPVAAGEVIQLAAHSEGWDAGPGDCGGYWYVNGFDGGDGSIGTVDSCGLYRAPPEWPRSLRQLHFEAANWHLEWSCADCCPYADLDLVVDHLAAAP